MKATFDIGPTPIEATRPPPMSADLQPPSEADIAQIRAGIQALKTSPPQPKHKPSSAREAAARIRAYVDPNADMTMVDTADLLMLLNEIQPA